MTRDTEAINAEFAYTLSTSSSFWPPAYSRLTVHVTPGFSGATQVFAVILMSVSDGLPSCTFNVCAVLVMFLIVTFLVPAGVVQSSNRGVTKGTGTL